MKCKNAILIFLLLFALMLQIKANDNLMVIVNKDTGTSSLSANQLKSMYLNDATTFDNGKEIQLTFSESSPIHNTFLKKIIKKTPSSFRIFWKKLVYSGEAEMPVKLNSDVEVIEFVTKNKNAIGYIAASSFKANDQIVKISIGEK